MRKNPVLAVATAANPRGVKLSGRVLEVRYVHEADGQRYKHSFKDGVEARLGTDGSVRLVHPKKRVWSRFRQRDGGTMPFLTNPARGSRRKGGGAMAKRKRRRSVARRRYRRNPMASVLFHGKPSSQKRWRRSGFRRNPISLSPRGLIRGVMEGAKDGAAIFGGEVVQTKARNAIQGFLPDTMRSTKSGGLIATIAAALVTSMIASRFLPGQIGRGVAGGAWAGAVRSSLVIAAPDVAGQLGAYQGYAEYAVQGGGDPLYLGDAGDVPMLGAGMGAYQEYPDVIPVMAS